MRQRAQEGRSVGARLALALLSLFTLLGALGSCTTKPDAPPTRLGKPCKGPGDCDETTFCRAADRDCGPGYCDARPDKNQWAEGASCGCDGKAYVTYTRAWMHGVDVGKNSRCLAQTPTLFPCGDLLLCGCYGCAPGEQVGYWSDVCVEGGNQYFCSSRDFTVHGCDDPSNEFIALCNGCIDVDLSACTDVTYAHYSCSTKGEGLYVSCW